MRLDYICNLPLKEASGWEDCMCWSHPNVVNGLLQLTKVKFKTAITTRQTVLDCFLTSCHHAWQSTLQARQVLYNIIKWSAICISACLNSYTLPWFCKLDELISRSTCIMSLFTRELKSNLRVPPGVPQFSLDKLVASTSPRGFHRYRDAHQGTDDWREEQEISPHGSFLHLSHFQLPWHYSLGLTNTRHQGETHIFKHTKTKKTKQYYTYTHTAVRIDM